MKSLFFLLPLLSGIFAFPQDTQDSNCESDCPLVNCQTEDPLKLCECINNRETLCKKICPMYQPVFVPCPRKPLPIRAADPAPATCVCESVFCPQSWPESCYCENDAKKACYDKCGGAPPTYATCPPRTVAAREPEPAPAVCKCDNVFCPQVWPDSCYCANDAKKACYEKCGGNIPIYDTCPPRGVTARAAVPVPAPAPTAEPACVCEDVMCIQSWPDSCLCRNEANKKCYEKCGGEVPEYQDCSPLDNTPVVPRAAEPQDECKCTEIFCLQIWPEGCYCANYAKELCYKECGGEKPVLEVCPPLSTPSLTTVPLPPTVLPTPAVARRATPTNQVCGGGRGSPYLDCPAGQICITNPLDKGSCGPACDQTGICVEDKMCGGFAGFDCDKEGQVCVDDSRDDCDPENGGSDCAGRCAWPQ